MSSQSGSRKCEKEGQARGSGEGEGRVILEFRGSAVGVNLLNGISNNKLNS